MMYEYEIVLKNEKEKTYSVISWLLLLINLVTIILYSISFDLKNIFPLVFAIIAFATLFLAKYFKGLNEKFSYYFPFFFFAAAWFFTVYPWVGLVNLVFGALNMIARRKLIVRFLNDKVIYPSAFPRQIQWTEISNAVLKDDILTIDLKNNKLIQQKIDRIYTTINEDEFNDFCRQQLNVNQVI